MNQTLYHLNKLGQLYHSYFGFHPEESCDYISQECYYTDSEMEYNELVKYFNDEHSIFDVEGNHITDVNDIKMDAEYAIEYDYNEILNESRTIVDYNEVVIKYKENTWYGKLREWYNEPRKNLVTPSEYLKPYILPYLNTRSYITIVEPFMKVVVSKEKKGTYLNIDDILFATRALMIDETRTVNGGYTILSETEETLVVEPDIDNYST